MPTYYKIKAGTAAIAIRNDADWAKQCSYRPIVTRNDNLFKPGRLFMQPGNIPEVIDDSHKAIFSAAYASMGYFVFVTEDFTLCVPAEDVETILELQPQADANGQQSHPCAATAEQD